MRIVVRKNNRIKAEEGEDKEEEGEGGRRTLT